jgi:hypothetical protein
MPSERCGMRRRALILALAIVMVVLLGFQLTGQPVAQITGQQLCTDESIQDLKNRIQKLETQIGTMQKRIDDLEFRSSVMPIIPGSSQIPPGARPFYFNGMQFWQVPVSLDLGQNGMKDRK